MAFPSLIKSIADFEKFTDFEEERSALKFATDEELSIGTRAFYRNKMAPVVEAIDTELTKVLGEFWVDLKAQSNTKIAIHTVLVLWRVTKMPLIDDQTESEKNIIKWGSLLHDIGKRGAPLIVGRDHCHGFRSAAISIRVLQRLGFISPGENSFEWN